MRTCRRSACEDGQALGDALEAVAASQVALTDPSWVEDVRVRDRKLLRGSDGAQRAKVADLGRRVQIDDAVWAARVVDALEVVEFSAF